MKQAFSHTFRMAALMDKNRLAAARIRMRFLDEEVDRCLEEGSDIALYWAIEALEEKCYLIKNVNRPVKSKNRIDDDAIERAKNYPIEDLISFTRGKAYAWCHSDKSPSLSLWKSQNKARCFPCGKTFNTIDVLMQRDGKTFIEAVKELS